VLRLVTATLTAVNATTGNQATTYVYGTTLTDSDVATRRNPSASHFKLQN
jgi:hypothetical protein